MVPHNLVGVRNKTVNFCEDIPSAEQKNRKINVYLSDTRNFKSG